jgi:histidinol-phosphate aminotransferase
MVQDSARVTGPPRTQPHALAHLDSSAMSADVTDVSEAPGAARLPVRPELLGASPYGAPQLDVPVRLNTNENTHPVPPAFQRAVVEAVAGVAGELNRYPDREFTRLREAFAGYLGHGLTADAIWAGNGSNEVLQHVLQAFGGPGRVAMGFTPSYAMYPLYCRGTGTGWVDGLRGALATGSGGADPFVLEPAAAAAQVRRERPDVVLLASPNNPTGTALDLEVVEAVYAATDGVVVVDEAYAEFARAGTPSALTLLPGRERLAVSRTMSKAFAFAGARVGYLAAAPAFCDALRLVRLPYHLSVLTQAAAIAAIGHREALLATVEAIKAQRDRIVTELAALGARPVPSDANFVLFGGLTDARAAWEALLERGVLVRDVGIPGHLRVSAGTEAETTAFLAAAAAVLPPLLGPVPEDPR